MKHVAWTLVTQYWTDLHGIALKNNELNVAMADMTLRVGSYLHFVYSLAKGCFC